MAQVGLKFMIQPQLSLPGARIYLIWSVWDIFLASKELPIGPSPICHIQFTAHLQPYFSWLTSTLQEVKSSSVSSDVIVTDLLADKMVFKARVHVLFDKY